MELFFSSDIEGGICRLDKDESGHCVKVLRHRSGDEISVIDGCGTLYRCRITSDNPKDVEAMVLEETHDWGGHPYRLHMAVCPTKNNDRYEWFVEKACEIGLDEISPVIGEHSERRVFKTARVEKILVSAAKQSLKGAVPVVNEPLSVKEFIEGIAGGGANKAETAEADGGRTEVAGTGGQLKLIAYCFEDERVPRRSIKKILEGYKGSEIVVLIGPEGDFSKAEAELAIQNGFIPVHLGNSRLRTETAALTAVAAAYFRYMV
jgi:16S rRNA (uracil1498-N3)-methyltransferase